jgi:hypothetical protein
MQKKKCGESGEVARRTVFPHPRMVFENKPKGIHKLGAWDWILYNSTIVVLY